MTIFSKPLVALSLTEPDEGLLRYAAMLARKLEWPEVHFLHVVPPERSGQWESLPWQEKMHAEVDRLFDVSVSSCQRTYQAMQGSRLDGILAAATTSQRDLIVLGHRRMRSGRRSLARRTAMIAPASVWLVPEGSPPKITEILVPTDFSQPSADALAVGAGIAKASRIQELHAVHVFFDPSTIRFDEHLDEVLGKEEEEFQKFLVGVETQGVDVEPVYHESTRPSQAILRMVDRCASDLIVMSTRGRSQAASVLLGSTTSELMAATTVPVLAVKHFGSHITLLDALRNLHLWEGGTPKTN
jgi:nucleotide-binding universal stress UspA family protein